MLVQVRNWDFTIISVHLKAENWGGKDKSQVEVSAHIKQWLLCMLCVDICIVTG